jgi:hypothetical protein
MKAYKIDKVITEYRKTHAYKHNKLGYKRSLNGESLEITAATPHNNMIFGTALRDAIKAANSQNGMYYVAIYDGKLTFVIH